jgi:hypothetical protein
MIAGAAIGFATAIGRAESTVGQSAMMLADIEVVSRSGSGAWQCEVLDVVS